MALLAWDAAYETGIDYIDYEHRRLVELINRICDDLTHAATKDRIADALGQLHAQISAHFALEETLMRERRYDLYEVHKADHEALLEEIRYMMDAFDSGACEHCGKTLEKCLTSWFRKHFRTKDARLESLRR